MSTIVKSPDPDYPMDIDLRNPAFAALWAWLWPGAGHLYQRRYAKGLLFMVCILSTYFFGFGIGGWRVVYASFRQPDLRLPYLCQLGIGLPALPAIVEWHRAYSNPPKDPLFGGVFRPPGDSRHKIQESLGTDRLAAWHLELKGRFELGTLFTMIAGLLNILAVYDAFAGPSFMLNESEKNKVSPKTGSAIRREATVHGS
jgi:hypothetical protein